MEEVFHTTDLKPKYGLVHIHNGAVVTILVFDMKAMILSILHDTVLMQCENVAEGLDIFTGDVESQCEVNPQWECMETSSATFLWIGGKIYFQQEDEKQSKQLATNCIYAKIGMQ